jgi:hypothetical protein
VHLQQPLPRILDKLKGHCFTLLYFRPWQNISEFAEKVDLLDLCRLGYFTSSIIRTVPSTAVLHLIFFYSPRSG